MIDANKARQQHNIELTSKYEQLCQLIRENAAEVSDADSANDYIDWVKSLAHLMNSKAVALTCLQSRVKELGLTYNKKESRYERA